MKEKIFSFGKNQLLTGTLTLGDSTQSKPQSPCFIMLNSGLVYQAGPNRLHVELARVLAAQGVTCFRFDLSNVGDSDKHRDERSYQEQIAADISDALDFLQQDMGISSFVLFGICTGADNAHKAAVADKRVAGAVFLDGYAYRTPGYFLRHLLGYYPKQIIRKLATPAWFLQRLSKFLPKQNTATELESAREQDKEDYYWSVPSKAVTMAELQQLIDRDVRQLHIFSPEWFWCFNHEKQFFKMYQSLDFNHTAQCVYFPRTDHLYTLQADRLQLFSTISNWMKDNFANR